MREFQKNFTEFVQSGSSLGERLTRELVAGGRLTLQKALEVHSKGFVARLTESLGETFEGVWWVLGDQEFFEICHRFIKQTPSRTYNLSEYGRLFPMFLKEHPDGRAPFLADLARFEWAFHECFHSPKPEQFDHSELHILHTCSRVTIHLQKNTRLYSSPYSVYPIFKVRGETAETAGELNWDHPEQLFIYKRDHSLFVQHLDPASFYILELMAQGLPLDQTIDRTALLFGDLKEEQVSQLFGDLIKAGVIHSIQPT
jgi:hypothetical protein